MASMYAKLMSRITESSLMEEDLPVRYCFLMLLAVADPQGYAIGTDIALARRMNMPVADFKRCVGELMKPDADSNSKEHEGRRVIESDCERGYFVVNYTKYRDTRDEEHRREYMREYMRKKRNSNDLSSVNSGKQRKPRLAKAEAEVKEEADSPKAPAPASPPLGGGKKDVLPTTPEALAISELFSRRTDTAWSPKEITKFRDLIRRGVATLETIATVAAYYRSERAKGSEGRHRRDLSTFLNNFDGELDRAQAATNGSNGVRSSAHHIPSSSELDAR